MSNITLSKGETPNETTVHLPGLTIWFSYETPIAFRSSEGEFVRENDWGPTTGKHLNRIDGGYREGRIPGSEFEERLQVAIDTAMHQRVNA